jgi:hypothetical protein
MKKNPTKSTENTEPIPDRKISLLTQYGMPHSGSRITGHFVQRAETEWPKPSAAELALIAIGLGNGPEACTEAVRLVWDCAIAQEDQLAAVRKFRERKAQYENDMQELEINFKLKPGDYSISHASFLSALDLREIQVRPAVLVRGRKLWMEFLRHLPIESLFRDTLHDSFLDSASGQSAEEWETEREGNGWVKTEILLWFSQKFGDWRRGMISANKRTGGKAKKPRSGGQNGTPEPEKKVK